MSDWDLQLWTQAFWLQQVLLANATGWPLAVQAESWEQSEHAEPSESQEDGFQTDKLLQLSEKALTVLDRVTRASSAGGLRRQLAGVKDSFEHVYRVAAKFRH